MISFKLDANAIELDEWGPPEELAAVTLEGKPIMYGIKLYNSGNGQILSGIYEVTKGKFKVIYPFHEHATVLSGKVTLTDKEDNSVTYGPGDSWFCHQGEVVTWDVKDRLRKTFFVVTVDQFGSIPPERIVQSVSKVVG